MEDNLALLHGVKEMDAEALAKVFDLYAPAIYKYAFRQCGNAVMADQIVGDVFAKLLEQLSQGNGPCSNIRSYLFEMAYHAIVDEIRRIHRMMPISIVEDFLPAANYTDLAAEDQVMLDALWRAMKNDLTDHQRHVVILRLLEGFSLKETAQIMGKTVNNIKVTQNRAVAVLRRAIDHQVLEHRHIEQNVLM